MAENKQGDGKGQISRPIDAPMVMKTRFESSLQMMKLIRSNGVVGLMDSLNIRADLVPLPHSSFQHSLQGGSCVCR